MFRRLCLVMVLPLFVVGCTEGTPSGPPPAFIEDGTAAADKPADEVTRQGIEFFTDWLKDHGESDVVTDGNGVGIAGSPTRLYSFLYGSSVEDTGATVEVEYRIVLPDRREIVEFVAGMGATEDAAIGMCFTNFTLSTFHVVYSSFMNANDPHISHEAVTIGGQPWTLTTAGVVAFGGEDLPEFGDVSREIQGLVRTLNPPRGTHWLKAVYGRTSSDVLAADVTLDNEAEPVASAALPTLNWPATDDFYMAKQFFVLRPVDSE